MAMTWTLKFGSMVWKKLIASSLMNLKEEEELVVHMVVVVFLSPVLPMDTLLTGSITCTCNPKHNK